MVLFSQTRAERARKRTETLERIRREEAQKRDDRPAYPKVGRRKKRPTLPFANKKMAKVMGGIKTQNRKMGTQYGSFKFMVSGAENGSEMELQDDKLVAQQYDGEDEGETAVKGGGKKMVSGFLEILQEVEGEGEMKEGDKFKVNDKASVKPKV